MNVYVDATFHVMLVDTDCYADDFNFMGYDYRKLDHNWYLWLQAYAIEQDYGSTPEQKQQLNILSDVIARYCPHVRSGPAQLPANYLPPVNVGALHDQ